MDVKLIMFKTNGQQKEFPVVTPVTTIGRGENCELRVPLLSVSRRQCEIRLAGQQLKVKDLASSNGTYVNNKRVNEAILKAGDRLVVGPIVFTVQIDGVPEEIKPVKTRGQQMAEVGAKGGEEIIDLEADVSAKTTDESDVDAVLELAEDDAGAPTEDLDPIAALEALAGDTTKKKTPPPSPKKK
jgi:pSer/pThr/pTyr-binding forkhead associated (FHA) protein